MSGQNNITEKDLALFLQGEHTHCHRFLGAHKEIRDRREGYRFAVWAPFVKSVCVTGEFDLWNSNSFYMTPVGSSGIWETFVPDVKCGTLYKYVIETQDGEIFYKADPYAFSAETRPGTASKLADLTYEWGDHAWVKARDTSSHFEKPLNIYEIHLGSWKRHNHPEEGDGFLTYTELAHQLPQYIREMGYTHVEFMPVMEHPFDGSWGYQLTGYFAPTSRFGTPQEFKYLVDCLHRAGIGVILDWVPGHFCRDEHGLCRFNGSKLYEIEEHIEWGTFKFDVGRPEVQSFLISSLIYWIEEYHADGIRVDGVSSMLYLNFGVTDDSRKRYNCNGGEEDLTAKAFLQKCNTAVSRRFPSVFMCAEESTAWPLVTYPPEDGGLGFHYKWNMGWMNDTLEYCCVDFPYRPGCHNMLTFSIMYAFSENFILPLSHDEVVHGKRSLMGRMPGDYLQQFAGTRLLLLYQMTHPGSKLTFMGTEIAPFIEWRFYEELEWFLLEYDTHAAHRHFVSQLNRCYLQQPSLWQQSYIQEGHQWIDADNNEQSILIYRRHGRKLRDFAIIVLNFQPQVYHSFKIGVPFDGAYKEVFNSDRTEYGGSGHVNAAPLPACKGSCQGQEQYIEITIPPIGGVIITQGGTT